MLTMKLLIERILNCSLSLGYRQSINHDRTGFRKFDLALTIDDSAQSIRPPAPHVHCQAIPRPKNVTGAGRKIHRQFIRIAAAVSTSIADKKCVASESAQLGYRNRKLRIEI